MNTNHTANLLDQSRSRAGVLQRARAVDPQLVVDRITRRIHLANDAEDRGRTHSVIRKLRIQQTQRRHRSRIRVIRSLNLDSARSAHRTSSVNSRALSQSTAARVLNSNMHRTVQVAGHRSQSDIVIKVESNVARRTAAIQVRASSNRSDITGCSASRLGRERQQGSTTTLDERNENSIIDRRRDTNNRNVRDLSAAKQARHLDSDSIAIDSLNYTVVETRGIARLRSASAVTSIVHHVALSIASHVAASTMPVDGRPSRVWNCLTAVSVLGPKIPSIFNWTVRRTVSVG